MIKKSRALTIAALVASATLLGGLGVTTASAAPAPTCTKNVGGIGLSAAVVAHAGETIARRTVDATGCDIGIYIGEGAQHVSVRGVTVTGAAYDGILAMRTRYVTVDHSVIRNNGYGTINPKAPALPGNGLHSYVAQSFGISLFGVAHAKITNNAVDHNGRGGIGAMDIGSFNPGALTQNPKGRPGAAANITISGNTLSANFGGCAIVAATQNPRGRVVAVDISHNTIKGTGMSKTMGPDIGGIVIAANTPGSSVVGATVHENSVSRSFEGGIIVNAESYGSHTWGVMVDANTVTGGNNWGALEAPKTAGIIVFANPAAEAIPNLPEPATQATLVWNNTVAGQFYGVYSAGDDAPLTNGNRISVTTGGTAIAHE